WAFFFSSRRRHTRFSRDWSSDVCSSDLQGNIILGQFRAVQDGGHLFQINGLCLFGPHNEIFQLLFGTQKPARGHMEFRIPGIEEIGRASCRERAWSWVGAAAVQRNKNRK